MINDGVLYSGIGLKQVLSSEEQKKHLELSSQGDQDSRNILFEHNLRLVAIVLNKHYYNSEYDNEELFQVGCIGLWNAIQRFDFSFGNKFSTYAVPLIYGEIRRFIRDNNLVHIPEPIRKLSFDIFNLKSDWDKKNNNRELSISEISEILDVPESDIILAINSKNCYVSISSPIYTNLKDGSEISIEESLADTDFSIDENLENEVLFKEIEKLLNYCAKRERQVVKMLYGFGCSIKNQREVGKILNISQAHVSRINLKVIKYLENSLPKNVIDEVSPKYIKKQICKKISSSKNSNNSVGTFLTTETKIIFNKEEGNLMNISKSNSNFSEQETPKKLKTIFEFFSEYTQEQVLNAIDSLKEKNKRIIELKYGLNGNLILSTKEIAEQFGMSSSNMSVMIVNSRIAIGKRLQKERISLLQDSQMVINNPEIEDEDIITLKDEQLIESTSNVNVTNFEDKIKEIKESILSNQFGNENKLYDVDGIKVEVKVYQTLCLFASRNIKQNMLDTPHGQKKYSYVYVITATGLKNELLSEYVLVRDMKKNEVYRFVFRNTAGEYDLNAIRDDELVCYDIDHIQKYLSASKEEIIIKPLVVESSKDLMQKPFVKSNYTDEKSTYTNQQKLAASSCLKFAIEAFKSKYIINAENEFLKALATDDKYTLQKTNFYLGKIYMAKRQPIIAEKYLEASLKLNGTNYNTLLEMGKSLLMQERCEEAIKFFDDCGAVNKFSDIHIEEKGKCYIIQRDFENAIKQFDLAISNKPTNYFARSEKGKLLYDLGKYDEARNELDICDSLAPQNTLHKITLGKIEYVEGKYDEAFRLFDECIKYDIQRNAMQNIANIGYFFHQNNEMDLAYEYYRKSQKFRNWEDLSDEEIEDQIKKHTSNNSSENIHLVFNFPVSLDILNGLIKDMEITSTKELYDIYQIKCKDAGYMIIDENNTKSKDFITIFTLPFTKKIMISYPDSILPNAEVYKSITLQELLKNAESKNESQSIVEEETLESISEITSELTTNFQNSIKDVNAQFPITSDYETEEAQIVKPEKDLLISQPNETVEEPNVTLVTNIFQTPISIEFKEHRDQIKDLIGKLDDIDEKTLLLLRLGFIRNTSYTEQQIGKFLGIDVTEVNDIINRGLSNIVRNSTIAIQGAESAREQLELIRKSKN